MGEPVDFWQKITNAILFWGEVYCWAWCCPSPIDSFDALGITGLPGHRKYDTMVNFFACCI